MIPFRKSIGFRLLGISIILLAIPLLVDFFIFLENRYEQTVEVAQLHLSQEVEARLLPLSQIQVKNEKIFHILSFFLNLNEDFPSEQTPKMYEDLKHLSSLNDYYGILLLKVTDKGQYVVVSSSMPEYDNKDLTRFFQSPNPFSQAGEKSGYVTTIIRDKETQTPFLLSSYGILKDDKPVGVIAIVDNIQENIELLLQQDEYPYPIEFAMFLPSSFIFAATDPHLRFRYFHRLEQDVTNPFREDQPANAFVPGEGIKGTDFGPPFIGFTWQNEKQIGLIKQLPGTEFFLLAYASRSDVIEAPFHELLWIYSSYVMILIIGVILAYFITKRMAKPISSLSRVMQQIQQGDLEKRYKKDPVGFEINSLGNIFNGFVDTLLEKQHIAEEERVGKEKYAQELAMGQLVQKSLLPQGVPTYEGVELAETFIPAIEVGGDFYDMFVKENDKLVLAVADAAGKGVQACCYSSILKNMLRTFAQEGDQLTETMRQANNLFCRDTGETGMFVTAFMGQYDHSSHRFDYYSYGHNPPVIYHRKDQSVGLLNHLDMAMGLMEKAQSPEAESIQLEAGDIVVMYSDGVTEAHDVEFNMFGEERLQQFIQREASSTASEIAQKLIAELNQFVGEAKQHDDITLIVLKVVS